MVPAEALRAAAALLADPAKHTTEAVARDAAGVPCQPRSHRAVRWCAYGAVRISARGTRGVFRAASNHLQDSAFALFEMSPDEVNDSLGHDCTILMLRHAAALADRATVH